MTELVAYSDGKCFIPLKRFEAEAKRLSGRRVILEIAEPQNDGKRRMFHATLREIYANLPDEIGDNFVNYDHFRYWCEIKCGFAFVETEVCASKAEAERFLSFIRRREPYAIVTREKNVVTLYTAKSTKVGCMEGVEFNKLVDAVLHYASALIGIKPEEAERIAAR